jgi:hypothetical protein
MFHEKLLLSLATERLHHVSDGIAKIRHTRRQAMSDFSN